MSDYYETDMAVYIRATAQDVSAALKSAREKFGQTERIYRAGAPKNEFAFLTPVMKIRDANQKILELGEEGIHVISKVRIGDL